MDWAETTARRDKRHLRLGIWCDLYKRFYGSVDQGPFPQTDYELTPQIVRNIGKPVCNDHLSNKIYYLWFIQ